MYSVPPRVLVAALAGTLLRTLLPSPAAALDLPRVGEVRPGGRGGVDWLDPHGWVRLRNDWDRTPQGTLRGVTFLVADARQARSQRLTFPVEPLRSRFPDLFVGPPNVEIVHFDGSRALLRFDRREPLRTISRYAVWTPATGALGEPASLGETVLVQDGKRHRVVRATWLAGADPAAGRLYFAETTYDPRTTTSAAPVSIRLTRVDFPGLQRDGWEAVITPPHRARPLPLEVYRAFSPDGRWLALAEYAERGGADASPPGDAPAQVYVVDLSTGAVASYAIPMTPYGLAFSRDGRHLAVGGHQDAEVVRIDLEAGRVDRRARVQPGLHVLVTSPSGDALLVLSDHRGAPRSIEVRRWSDLSLLETVPVSRLFPGLPGLHPSGIRATADGRFLVAPRYGREGFPSTDDAGLVTFAVDETASGAGRADPVTTVRPHVERTGLKLYSYQLDQVGRADGAFAPIAAGPGGEAFVLGTGAGGQPLAIWVDARGRVVWERSLRRGALFQEYEAGSAVFTPEGDVLAFLLGYVKPGAPAASRVVRLDRKGQVRWEWTSPLGPEARFADALRLLPGGTIRMTGHVGTTTTAWKGELDAATGKLLSEEAGAGR